MIWFDTETYCEVPISHGTYAYTAACECMIVTYAHNDDPPQLWDVTRGHDMPYDLDYLLDDPNEPITSHFAMFDRNVLRYALQREIPIHRWRCTMAQANAHGLPGSLDSLSDILKLDMHAKDKRGRDLIHLFCKPRPKASKIRRATRLTHPEKWQEFCEYALQDIPAMRAAAAKMPTWNYQGFELELYHLDQRINDRGMCVDVEFAQQAIRAVAAEQKRLAAATHEATHGEVDSATQRDKLLYHILKDYGVDLPDMQKDTIERRVNDTSLPIELRNLLAIRLQAASSSSTKYASLVRAVSADGRLRGTLQFDGAARTRRWNGRTFQPLNLPRPDMRPADIALSVDAIRAGAEHLVLPDVMRAARNTIRGSIIAPRGKKLVIADFANIEGRDAAWFGGEDWKLDAFRAYDAGKGPDLYVVAYAAAFDVSHDVVIEDKENGNGLMRQIGKVMELMLQYEGGVGAFITGAATYGIDLDELADAAEDSIPGDVYHEAERMFEWCLKENRSTYGLTRRVFVVCDSLKRMWRRRHPGIVALWRELKDQAIAAIENPGNTFPCGEHLSFRRDGAWLKLRLPSGNYLCYPQPKVVKGAITYAGVNPYTRQWSRVSTYGGKFFENVCQGFAGDLLKYNLPRIDAAGFDVVLLVHDEIVTEPPDIPEFSVSALAGHMTEVPPYAPGLPLAAAGFETYRYEKR